MTTILTLPLAVTTLELIAIFMVQTGAADHGSFRNVLIEVNLDAV